MYSAPSTSVYIIDSHSTWESHIEYNSKKLEMHGKA